MERLTLGKVKYLHQQSQIYKPYLAIDLMALRGLGCKSKSDGKAHIFAVRMLHDFRVTGFGSRWPKRDDGRNDQY